MNITNAVMNDIRDIRPPVELPLYVWVLIALLVCAIAGAVYFFLRKRKPVVVPPVPVIVRTPWEIAEERLGLLFQKKYPEQGIFKPFYSELSDIVRHYLEGRFQIKAPEMTTEEFLIFVKSTAVLTMDQKEALQGFLNGCDMVKFAKHEPNINEALANFKLAQQLIAGTKDGI